MQLSPITEDVLEQLYAHEVENVTSPLPTPDDRALGELLRHNLVLYQDGNLHLTREGRTEAESAVRRHRLAERLLHDVVDVHGQQVDASACEFEHSLHHGIDEQICTLLGHPKTCPHGRPIPPGPCCRQRRNAPYAAIVPLAEMKSGERGVIAYLSSRQPETVQKLMALGVLPGFEISIIQLFPSVVFQVGLTQVAVEKSLAADIYVRRVTA